MKIKSVLSDPTIFQVHCFQVWESCEPSVGPPLRKTKKLDISVDGNQKSGIHSPVNIVNVPLFIGVWDTSFGWLFGISDPSVRMVLTAFRRLIYLRIASLLLFLGQGGLITTEHRAPILIINDVNLHMVVPFVKCVLQL